jgi:hypothetical protein
MASSLRSTVNTQLGWSWRDHADTAPITDNNRLQYALKLADDGAAYEADAVWHVESQELSAGAAITLQLDALDKTVFGDTIFIGLLRVKAMLIVNRSGSGGGDLLLGGAEVDPWYEPFAAAIDRVKVPAGGALLMAHPRDGWEVVAGTTDLKLTAAGGDVVFDVAILGQTTAPPGDSSSSGDAASSSGS